MDAPDEAKQIAIAYLLMNSLVTIAGVIWIYRDAEARGKSGLAAALIVFLSAFHGISVVLIVMCVWILSRPKRTPPAAPDLPAAPELPHELPSGIVAGPTPNEFLKDLQNHTESGVGAPLVEEFGERYRAHAVAGHKYDD